MRISDWSSDVCSSDLGVIPIQSRNRSPDASEKGTPLAWTLVPGAWLAMRIRAVADICRTGFGPSGRRSPHAQQARTSDNNDSRRSEEHTSELQSLMRISYAVFCLKKKKKTPQDTHETKRTNYH